MCYYETQTLTEMWESGKCEQTIYASSGNHSSTPSE